MGGLTSNRKRQDGFLSLHNGREFCHFNSPEFRIFKKPRLGFSIRSPEPQEEVQYARAVSRVSRYPEIGSRLRREVLGPIRPTKFGCLLPVSSQERGDSMGNFLTAQYNRAKESALGTLKFIGIEKKTKVIDLVDEDDDERTRRKGSGQVPMVVDSCIEEIGGAEVVEESDERGRSAGSGSDYKLKDEDIGVVGNVAQESMVSELTNGDMTGLKSAEKMLGSLSLSKDGVEVLSKSAYKKLLEEAQRRDARLGFLDSQIRFNKDKWSGLQELRPVRKPEKKVPEEPFIPLTKEEEVEVSAAFSGSRRKVLVTHENSNIVITVELLQCLGPGAWLNDEVINVYLELLKEREKREPKKYLNCHFFNTFFYKKLIGSRNGYDYKSVRRWTSQRKLGYSLVDCNKIFVPIHKEIHWCLAVINKKDQKFQYLDSLGGRDGQVLKVLAKYYADEVKDKNGKDIDVSSWDQEFVEGLPEQENGRKETIFPSEGCNLNIIDDGAVKKVVVEVNVGLVVLVASAFKRVMLLMWSFCMEVIYETIYCEKITQTKNLLVILLFLGRVAYCNFIFLCSFLWIQANVNAVLSEYTVYDDDTLSLARFDCGMFMIKYADFYSRGLDLCFSQEHMPYFRLRTVKEILRLRAD